MLGDNKTFTLEFEDINGKLLTVEISITEVDGGNMGGFLVG